MRYPQRISLILACLTASALFILGTLRGDVAYGNKMTGTIFAPTTKSREVRPDESVAPTNEKCAPTTKSVSRASWEEKIQDESDFWGKVIAFYGSGWDRFNRTNQIAAALRPYLDLPDDATQSTEIRLVNILVVGSGPSSDIGYRDYDDAKVNLVLTDPLAKMYDALFKQHNAYPPHQIMPLAGEELECFFAPNAFNLVYSVNALDHSYDAVEALRQMVRVAVPCSWIVVELWENEANYHQGWGVHQWNFRKEGDRVVVEKYKTTTTYDVNDEMRKVGAEMSGTLFMGCYLNGDCNSQDKARLRMKIRKLSASGQRCPFSRVES